MNSYFYPTRPDWFDLLVEDWKKSKKRTLGFPFLWFTPSTLPINQSEKFWMYLYYSKSHTNNKLLQQVVEYRVRVVNFDFSVISHSNIENRKDALEEVRVWFECDLVEKIKRNDGQHLMSTDFRHNENKALLQSIRNSIAPVKCVSKMRVIEKIQNDYD